MYIDTHTHLYLDAYDNDRDEIIKNALEQGVSKMVLPDIDSTSTQKMLDLCKLYPNNCYPLIGLHPTSVKDDWEQEMDHVKEWLSREKFYGLGECGIDLYWDDTHVDAQKQVFAMHLELAKEHNLPVIIHARDSFNEIFEIIDRYNDDRLFGIFHCFTGTYPEAQQIIEYGGFKLGIGGVLTFRKSGLDKIISHIDLSHLVLETDSPYLAPVPYRGKRNQSAYLVYTAEKLAEIHEVSVEDVARITSMNAIEIFKFK